MAFDEGNEYSAYLSNYVVYDAIYGDTYAARPVVFLKSDITLSGSGTSEDPYTLS